VGPGSRGAADVSDVSVAAGVSVVSVAVDVSVVSAVPVACAAPVVSDVSVAVVVSSVAIALDATDVAARAQVMAMVMVTARKPMSQQLPRLRRKKPCCFGVVYFLEWRSFASVW